MAGPSGFNDHVWELSPYELHRKPHEMVTDSTVVAVSPRALRSELMCPICLDLMKTPQTTKECLHRFCQECIITALRSGNKECPTCRKKLISKRSLRSDPNFEALINKIYPDREGLNVQAEKYTPRRNQLITRRKRKAPDSRDNTETPPPEEKRSKESPSSDIGSPSPPAPVLEEEDDEVEMQVRPHPQDSSVANFPIRNLATVPMATVAHILKYIADYPTLDNRELHLTVEFKGQTLCTDEGERAWEHGYYSFPLFSLLSGPKPAESGDGTGDSDAGSTFSLYIQFGNDGQYTMLPGGTSLRQICENYWTPGDKLNLYFALDDRLGETVQ